MPTPDPEIPGGTIAGFLAALATLAGSLAAYFRLKGAKAPRLERIEAQLAILTRTLVEETPEGGHVTTSRALADKLSTRLDEIERLLNRRGTQLPVESKKMVEIEHHLAALRGDLQAQNRNIESLSSAVQSALDIMQDETRRRRGGE